MTRRSCAALLLLALVPWSTTFALDLRVGSGTGCTHPDLGAALLSLHAQTGTHTVRINKGAYAVPSGMAYRNPDVGMGGTALEREFEVTLTDPDAVRATIAAARRG